MCTVLRHTNHMKIMSKSILFKLRTIAMGHDKVCSQRAEMNSNRFTVNDADTIGQLSSLTLHFWWWRLFMLYTQYKISHAHYDNTHRSRNTKSNHFSWRRRQRTNGMKEVKRKKNTHSQRTKYFWHLCYIRLVSASDKCSE